MKVLVAILAAALIAIVGFHALDEDLSPAAAAFLQAPKPALTDEENAWFLLVGLMARDDPAAYAREWTAAAKEVRSEAQAAQFEARFAAARLARPSDVVLERYAQLYETKGLEEPDLRSPYAPLPYGAGYGYPWAHERTLENALIGSDSFRAALKALWQDTDLQRRMLAGSSYFVSKAVFTVALARNYLAVSALLDSNAGKARSEQAALAELLSPLQPDEVGMQRPVASQVRYLAALAGGQKWFPRPNAAANQAVPAARAALEFGERDAYLSRVGDLPGWADLAELLVRMQDLEALRALVAFQAGVAAEPPRGVKIEGRTAYIEPKSDRFKAFGRDGRIAVELPPAQSTQTRPTTRPAST